MTILGIILFSIDSEDDSVSSVCYGQMLMFLATIMIQTLSESSRFLHNSIIPCLLYVIILPILKILYIRRYFSIPNELCSKYWKTIFYLRILMIIDIIGVVILGFTILIMIFIGILSCLERFCPNFTYLHSLILSINGGLPAGASAAAISYVIRTLPRSKFNPEVNTNYKDCVICMQEFIRDEFIIALPCDQRHYFHEKCIKDCIVNTKKLNCPICRRNIQNEGGQGDLPNNAVV